MDPKMYPKMNGKFNRKYVAFCLAATGPRLACLAEEAQENSVHHGLAGLDLGEWG
jgi:hypothetical protein